MANVRRPTQRPLNEGSDALTSRARLSHAPANPERRDRVGEQLAGEDAITEKEMFGGVAFLLELNMSVGVTSDELIVWVGLAGTDDALQRPHARPFDMTGRPMKGWILVAAEGVRTTRQLAPWVQRGAAFRALAVAEGHLSPALLTVPALLGPDGAGARASGGLVGGTDLDAVPEGHVVPDAHGRGTRVVIGPRGGLVALAVDDGGVVAGLALRGGVPLGAAD